MKIQLPPSLFVEAPAAARELISFLKGLELGELMEVRVLKTLTPEHALVRIAGKTVLCRCPGDAAGARAFTVELASPWPEPILRSPEFGWELEPLVKKALMEEQAQPQRVKGQAPEAPARSFPGSRGIAKKAAGGPRARSGLHITTDAADNPEELTRFLKGLEPGDVLAARVVEARGQGRALIRVGEHTMDARCPESLKPGVPFRVQVIKKGPDLVLKVLADEEVVEPLVQKSLLKAAARLTVDVPKKAAGMMRFLKGLREGQVVEAEVLDAEGRDTAVMKMGEHTVVARVAAPLAPGAHVRLQTVSSWPELLFKMLKLGQTPERVMRDRALEALGKAAEPDTEELITRAAGELSAPENAQKPAAKEALDLLKSLSLKPESWDVKTYLEKSGLMLEQSLAKMAQNPGESEGPLMDLKAALLRALDALEGGGKTLKAATELLRLIEGCQALNMSSRGGETQLLVPLVLWGFERGDWGDMSLMRHSRRRGKGDAWSVTLRLKLSRLGRVHINMVFKGKKLSVTVRAGEQESLGRLEQGFNVLYERLIAGGFGSVDIKTGRMDENDGWRRLSLRAPDVLLDMHA